MPCPSLLPLPLTLEALFYPGSESALKHHLLSLARFFVCASWGILARAHPMGLSVL